MSYVVSVRIPDREIWERAKEHARKQGMSIGKMVAHALEFYMSREDRILKELEGLRKELRALRRPGYEAVVSEETKNNESVGLPSFLRDDPWLEILGKRGRK